MMRKLHANRQRIVALLLTGFMSVLVCDFLCDVGVISWGAFSAHTDIADNPTKAHHHHDSQTDHHHHDDQHDYDHNQDHKGDDCCDDMVEQVYASLIKYELKQHTFQPLAYYLLYQIYTEAFVPKGFSQKLLSFLYTNLPPPISGFHIRVFIQSFLN